jgi:hypothetical protein
VKARGRGSFAGGEAGKYVVGRKHVGAIGAGLGAELMVP